MTSADLFWMFGLLSGILSAACYIPYIRGIIRHEVKPERASWLIWSVLTVIGFFSNLAIGATHSLWLPGIQGLGVIIVFLLSLRIGYGGLLRRDIVTLSLSALTLVIWYFTNQPLIALYLTVLIDCMGGYLTIVKAYEEPHTETPLTWALSGCAGFFAVLSVGRWEVSLLLYPLYIFLVNSAVVVAILLGKQAEKQRKRLGLMR